MGSLGPLGSLAKYIGIRVILVIRIIRLKSVIPSFSNLTVLNFTTLDAHRGQGAPVVGVVGVVRVVRLLG